MRCEDCDFFESELLEISIEEKEYYEKKMKKRYESVVYFCSKGNIKFIFNEGCEKYRKEKTK